MKWKILFLTVTNSIQRCNTENLMLSICSGFIWYRQEKTQNWRRAFLGIRALFYSMRCDNGKWNVLNKKNKKQNNRQYTGSTNKSTTNHFNVCLPAALSFDNIRDLNNYYCCFSHCCFYQLFWHFFGKSVASNCKLAVEGWTPARQHTLTISSSSHDARAWWAIVLLLRTAENRNTLESYEVMGKGI